MTQQNKENPLERRRERSKERRRGGGEGHKMDTLKKKTESDVSQDEEKG